MSIRSTDCVPGSASQRDLSNIVYCVFAPPEAEINTTEAETKNVPLCFTVAPRLFTFQEKRDPWRLLCSIEAFGISDSRLKALRLNRKRAQATSGKRSS